MRWRCSIAPAAILASRLVEGAGYLVLVIATPALLATISPQGWKAPMLAIWGGFVPIGFAVADFTAQAMLPGGDPRAYLLLAIAAFAILAALAALLLRAPDLADNPAARPADGSFAATMTVPVGLVALAFGIYVVLSVGFFTFMPAYIAAPGSAILLSAGAIALLVPIGNVLASLLVGGRDAALHRAAVGGRLCRQRRAGNSRLRRVEPDRRDGRAWRCSPLPAA